MNPLESQKSKKENVIKFTSMYLIKLYRVNTSTCDTVFTTELEVSL